MRSAFTLFELLVACAIIGIVAAMATPRVRGAADALAVEAAAREVAGTLALGRLAALRHGGAEVLLDSLTLRVRAGGRELRANPVAQRHGVHLRVTPAVVRFAATGMAIGLSNGTIIVTRGRRADTVFVSRLGRVRRTR